MRADGQPGDKLGVAETEVVDGVRVRVSGHPDLFVAVAADDVLAAVAQGDVEEHREVPEDANAVAARAHDVVLDDVTAFVWKKASKNKMTCMLNIARFYQTTSQSISISSREDNTLPRGR